MSSKVRITQAGWENYTGTFGTAEFVDGVSVDVVSRMEIDRLSALIAISVIDDAGGERQAGLAARLVGGATIPAQVVEPLVRVSEDELVEERLKIMREQLKAPATVMTRDELEKLVEQKGLPGLRVVAGAWGVKGREIREIINGVIRAQRHFEDLVAKNTNEQRRIVDAAREDALAKQRAAQAAFDKQLLDNARVFGVNRELEPDRFTVDANGQNVQIDGRVIAQQKDDAEQKARDRAEEEARVAARIGA